jgi:hypothetical protein
VKKTVRCAYARKMSILLSCPETRKCRTEFLSKKLLDMKGDVVYRKILYCKNIRYDRNLSRHLEKVKVNCYITKSNLNMDEGSTSN